jgi:ATP-dependent Lon protease
MGTDMNTEAVALPLLPLRGLVIFPYMVLHFDVAREKSIAALEEAMGSDQQIFLVSQKDVSVDMPEPDELYRVGTISRIKQVLKLPGDTIRVLVEGEARARIEEFTQTEPFFAVEVVEQPDIVPSDGLQTKALMRSVMDSFEEYVKLSNKVTHETFASVSSVEDPGQISDIIASNVLLRLEDKQGVLECSDVAKRLEKVLVILGNEIEILQIERAINQRVRKQMDKSQREYYLREQIKAIQKELGEKETIVQEADELKKRLDETPVSQEAREKAEKEIARMSKMSMGSPEISVVRSYVEWILDLPWEKHTEDEIDLARVQKTLDEDHYGLTKVKDRVIEYLAVCKLTGGMRGNILCFVGPPGVGKTSVASSIAKALGRSFVRMSLGGVRDEAEIRGHRRTYIGAIPGRIISSVKQAKSMNPVFLLDEIDKMSSDFRGDPASAMLEVLDPEQNATFRDHYLDIAFDLSQVMFITTANTADTIPRPLLDRMEVIQLSSYTEDEKLGIALKHLLPKQLAKHGQKPSNLVIEAQAMRNIISHYTMEPGVRMLERRIADICRKAAREMAEHGRRRIRVRPGSLHRYLGAERYRRDTASERDDVGVVTGLAWTPSGGQTLVVEATPMRGDGKLELTGHLGDVMKESARAGLSYIRSKAEELGIDPAFYTNTDLHVHIPEGAIPKDGPSAGITMATAIISALSKRPVRRTVAMTGEITLRGRVLPIGGLKEKALAAHRAGIKKVIIPAENQKDLEEIPENVRKDIRFLLASDLDDVLETALI